MAKQSITITRLRHFNYSKKIMGFLMSPSAVLNRKLKVNISVEYRSLS